MEGSHSESANDRRRHGQLVGQLPSREHRHCHRTPIALRGLVCKMNVEGKEGAVPPHVGHTYNQCDLISFPNANVGCKVINNKLYSPNLVACHGS